MMTRSMTLLLSVFAGAGTAAAQATPAQAATPNNNPGGFQCQNRLDLQVVSCVGSIAILPVTVNIANAGVLDDSELNVLSDDLDNLSLKDINILDGNKILDDVQLTVLQDFLDKIGVDITKNDIGACVSLLCR